MKKGRVEFFRLDARFDSELKRLLLGVSTMQKAGRVVEVVCEKDTVVFKGVVPASVAAKFAPRPGPSTK